MANAVYLLVILQHYEPQEPPAAGGRVARPMLVSPGSLMSRM
jgi:hypothetical protein